MNLLLVISTSELVAVNAIAMQYVGRIDPISQLAALQIAELLLVISGSFNSVRRTDRSTELDFMRSCICWMEIEAIGLLPHIH